MTKHVHIRSDQSDRSDRFDIVRLIRSDRPTAGSDQSDQGPAGVASGPSGPTGVAAGRTGIPQSKQRGPTGPTGPTEKREDGVARTPEAIEAVWDAAILYARRGGQTGEISEDELHRDAYSRALAIGNRPRTWTGKVVSLEEWRRLTDWEKHGSTGKHWSGLTWQWEPKAGATAAEEDPE